MTIGSYKSWRGVRIGVTLWQVETDRGNMGILLDGVMDLMWTEERLVFAGADTTAMISPSDDRGTTWGLRLAPGTAYSLLGIPARELADQRIDLSDLVTVPTSALDAAYSDPAVALERTFATLWSQAEYEPFVLRLAAAVDCAARAGLCVPDIAARHGLSERSLVRYSDKLFGYGSKTLASIHRFQYALHLTRSGMPLSEASTVACYVDQSHLNHDSQRLAGTTPRSLVA